MAIQEAFFGRCGWFARITGSSLWWLTEGVVADYAALFCVRWPRVIARRLSQPTYGKRRFSPLMGFSKSAKLALATSTTVAHAMGNQAVSCL